MNEGPATLNAQQLVESAWRDQAIWSEVANRLKAELSMWRNRAAVAGVLGAFLGTLAATLGGLGERWWWLRALIALAGAVVLAVVPYVVRTKVSKDRVREWVRARSASEALKEIIYRYLVGAPSFNSASSPADLIKRCQTVKEKVRDLNIYAASIAPPRKVRPLTLTADGYVESRVNDEVEGYYRPKGREKAFAAKRLHDLEFGLGLLAVVMAAMASAAAATGVTQLSLFGPWVAVVTTASAAVTAHLAASRYDHEAMTYFGTADRLIGLRDEWLVNPNRLDPTCVARFVDDCEHAISTENEAWLAEWTRERAER
jgi:SMODS and SLOG-associating 2TM effector domain 1/SMODS and SLOG-associating 2TM effector domain 3